MSRRAKSAIQFAPRRDRVLADIQELAKYGSVGPSAITRLAFTNEDLAARKFIISLMKDAGLQVAVDAFGNIFGKRPGRQNRPSVVTGSHLDGPPMGGIYDGTVGVLGGVECARLFNELGLETEYPVEIAVLAAEHLDRFGLGCLGSRAISGKLKQLDLQSLTDRNGITIWTALEKAGFSPERLETVRRTREDVLAFVELHIEQGPVLERSREKIGVVTSISGPTRLAVTVLGETNHSGGTPMGMRRDALVAAAEIVLAVEGCAKAEQEYGTVGTVGVVQVEPGSMVAIPGKARLLIDIRSVDWNSKQRVLRCLEARWSEIAQRRQVEVEMAVSVDEKPVPCSPKIIEVIEMAAQGMNMAVRRMPSGGGHDTQHMAAITDVGMIFVPSIRGISHAPEEFTDLDDICRGITILAGSLWQLGTSCSSAPLSPAKT